MDATENKNTAVFNLQEQEEFLFDYLNSLSPLKTKKCVTTRTLNSLGMDYSLVASPDASVYEDSIVLMRNNTLSTSKPAHACQYSLEPSSQHTNIELPKAMHDNPCSSEQRPLISTEEANWVLELLGMQVPNGTNVQDDSMKDSVEGGTYIREVGQIKANIEGADSLHLSAKQGHHLSPVPAPMERHLEPSENDDFTKSSVHIPGEDLCWSTPDLMSRVKFNDLTNKLLDQNMKRTSKMHSKDSVGLVSSGSEHEMEEESVDFSPKRKRKRSDLTGEGGACRSCKCKKSRCLKNYCECFAAGVYCIGPCSCQDCSNKGDNEDTVLQARRKNDSKVVTSSNSSPQFGEDPNITLASKLQKRVCNCNKSGCQRKYCACFKDGVGCSPICRCQGCKNIHGRKDNTAETKSELEETKALPILLQ